jgi:hypothetical protein
MQTHLIFPPDLFTRVRASYNELELRKEIEKLREENKQLKYSQRAYKGHTTKRNNKP